jgi:hypothetical protein
VTVGTRSVLYGAHCFPLHGWFVALAWYRLYGFRRIRIGWTSERREPHGVAAPTYAHLLHPALWVAFFVHDLGYLGKPNMDGPEGETHPILGAAIMNRLFGREWGTFTLTHSRYYAKARGLSPSPLCMADKLAIALVPAWLYLPMVRATGEIEEYMAHAKYRSRAGRFLTDTERRKTLSSDQREWYLGVQSYCARWAWEHRDGRVDTWTSDPSNRATLGDDGVWR